jgi:uncharacterized protein YidB (DUF937 family)
MGLLDSVLGSLANGQLGGRGAGQAGGQGGLGDLLGQVLGNAGGGGGGRGGLGGLGGGGAAALIAAALAMLSQNGSAAGGLGALLDKFRQGGLGDVAGSWVSPGQNLPVSPDQVQDVLGSDLLGQLASQLGISPQDAGAQLSQWLPQVVDQLTPAGQVPTEADLGGFGDIGAILGRFGQR